MWVRIREMPPVCTSRLTFLSLSHFFFFSFSSSSSLLLLFHPFLCCSSSFEPPNALSVFPQRAPISAALEEIGWRLLLRLLLSLLLLLLLLLSDFKSGRYLPAPHTSPLVFFSYSSHSSLLPCFLEYEDRENVR